MTLYNGPVPGSLPTSRHLETETLQLRIFDDTRGCGCGCSYTTCTIFGSLPLVRRHIRYLTSTDLQLKCIDTQTSVIADRRSWLLAWVMCPLYTFLVAGNDRELSIACYYRTVESASKGKSLTREK